MRWLVPIALATITAGCASRQPVHPFIPRRAMHSGTSVVAAQAGVMSAAVGAHMASSRRSPGRRRAGAALVATGGALMGAAVAEAIRAGKEREILYAFDAAWRRDMRGTPAVDDPVVRPLPPPPVNPWEFRVDSPLGGEPDP